MSNSGAKYLFTSVQGNDTVSLLYITVKKSQSVPVTDPVVAQRVGRGIALLFHERCTRRRWVVSSTPWPYFSPGKDPVPIVQEAGWKNLAPPGLDPRVVQPVVSCYTDWANRSTCVCVCVCMCVVTYRTARNMDYFKFLCLLDTFDFVPFYDPASAVSLPWGRTCRLSKAFVYVSCVVK